jgi:hypothetical protein
MRKLGLALLVLATAASASAQDGSESGATRTPESAQRFLAEFYAQGDLTGGILMIARDGSFVPWPVGASIPTPPGGK